MRYAMKESWGSLTCKGVFEKMDSDNDGYITVPELDRVLSHDNCSSEVVMFIGVP